MPIVRHNRQQRDPFRDATDEDFDPRREQSPIIPSLRRFHGGVVEVPVDLPAAQIQGPSPEGPQPEGGVPIELPGVFAPAFGSIPVELIGDANIAPAAEAVIVTYQVPEGFRFRMAGIGFSADDETALRFLTWRIEVSSTRVPPYVSVPAGIGSIIQLSPIFFPAPGGQRVDVIASSDPAAGATFRFICRVQGWTYIQQVRQ
jgi:hypothetical protein